MIKPLVKVQEAMIQMGHQDLPMASRNPKVKKRIVQLTEILDDWDEETYILAK